MAKNKNLLEEALREAETFRTLMAENVSSLIIKEGLENTIEEAADDEESFDETDVDAELDVDTDIDADADIDVDADLEVADEDLDVEDLDVEDEDIDFEDESEDEDIELDDDMEGDADLDVADEEEEDVVLDMTDASDDEVIRVFKKMSDDDEIEITDDAVKITDPESGNEYKVEMGGEEDETLEEGFDFGFDLEDLEFEDEMGNEDMEGDFDPYQEAKYSARNSALSDMDQEEGFDTEEGEYEAGRVNKDQGFKEKLDLSPVGDVEDEPLFEIEIEDEEEVFEEVEYRGGQVEYVAEEEEMLAEDENEDDKSELEQLKEAYETLKSQNAILTKASKELVKENATQRKALEVIKERIQETKVYTQNINAVSRLFIEHSTTKAEKEAIVERFKGIKTLNESIQLEKQIKTELGSRESLTESVGTKINININSGVSKSVINEGIVDPQIAKARRLM